MVYKFLFLENAFKSEFRGRKKQMEDLRRYSQRPMRKLIPFLSKLFNKFILDKKSKPAILFTELRYKYIIESLKSRGFRCIVLVSSFDDIIYALKNRLEIYPGINLVSRIVDYYDGEITVDSLCQYVSDELIKLNVNNIIMYKDYPPINLLLTLASKNTNIKTIVIQHGICTLDGSYYDGEYADLVLVWGDVWKKYYAKFIPMSKIKVVGYPYKIENLPYNQKDTNIIFLSQNIENYINATGRHATLQLKFDNINELMSEKLKYTENISEELRKYGKKLIIKPHPGDSIEQFKNLKVSIFTGTMTECLHRYNKFISLSSSALLDASINNMLAIQIRNDKLSPKTFNFEKYGICYSIDQDSLNELKILIDSTPYKIDKDIGLKNSNYMETLIKCLNI
jgi:hypothetical protein